MVRKVFFIQEAIYIYINVSNETLYSTVRSGISDTVDCISFKRD